MRPIIIWGPPRGNPRGSSGLLGERSEPRGPSPDSRQIKSFQAPNRIPTVFARSVPPSRLWYLCPTLGLSFPVCTMGRCVLPGTGSVSIRHREQTGPANGSSVQLWGSKTDITVGDMPPLPIAACRRWLRARREDSRICGHRWPAVLRAPESSG